MNRTAMIAEVERLEAEIETILAVDTTAYLARRTAEGKTPMPHGWRLRMSERSKPLRARAMDLRRQAEALFDAGQAAAPALSSALSEIVASAVARASAPLREDNDLTPATSANASLPRKEMTVSAERYSQSDVDAAVEKALAEIRNPSATVGAKAPHLQPRALTLEQEIDAIAARIAASDCPAETPHAEREVVSMAQAIVGDARLSEGEAEIDAIAKRIAAA